jgi:Uma2 family endonuclease
MTALLTQDKVGTDPGNDFLTQPRPRPWSAEELYRLLSLGFFDGQRVELIEGEILQMASQSNWHAQSITLTRDVLAGLFGNNHWVRVQMSLDLTLMSVPDPDIAVISGSVRDNAGRDNPKSALLIVEVSETTLVHDRKRKASLYAKARIMDYWIVNLEKRFLEVYRNPVADQTKEFGFGYQDVQYLEPTDEISPLAMPQGRIKVADLLP